MNKRKVDVAIIGAGTAGLNARRQVEKDGGMPLMIESGPYGTTCARVGCMPSKLLIAAADVAHEISHADRFGLKVDGWHADGNRVFERVKRERDRFAGFVVSDTEAMPEEQRLRGHARFIGPTTLLVDDHTQVEANAIVIATGSAPFIPPPYDAIRDQVIVNDDVFELSELPQTIAVIGTGIIGLELGQALHRLGTKVTFFSPRDNVGPASDPAIKRSIHEVLSQELDLQLNVDVHAARPVASGIELMWRDADKHEHTTTFEKVLVAAGRRPNLTGIDLDKAELNLNQQGQPAWNSATTQCGDAPIFMAGDVSAHLPLLHEASDEGRIAGKNALLYPHVKTHARRTPLAVAFTDPQIAMIGQRYDELNLDEVEIGEVSFSSQGRARVMGQNRGLLRVYADKKCCRLIGAEMFGPRMEHISHLLAWAVQQRMTITNMLEMPFYHPVIEEGLRTALRDLAKKLKITGDCRSQDMAAAPGA